jgi:hypothetical protein
MPRLAPGRTAALLRTMGEGHVMTHWSDVLARWTLLSPYLDRRHQMLWAAAEAHAIGYGGHQVLSRITGISSQTISKWTRTLHPAKKALPGSLAQVRTPSRAGRKLCEVKNTNLIPALERMLTDEIAGDPITNQRWVRSSLRNLSGKLKEQGHQACTHTVARCCAQWDILCK